MAEFTVAGHKYKSGKLSAFKQFHVARRLGPILGSLGEAYRDFEKTKTAGSEGDPLAVLGPVGEACANISDEDSEYIFNTCLSVCQRFQDAGNGNGIWAAVHSGGGPMFHDIGMMEILQICWHVLQDNINFLAFMPGASPGTTPAPLA